MDLIAKADMGVFLYFIDLEKYLRNKVNGVGENAYWSPIRNIRSVYHGGIIFTLKVDIFWMM